MEFVAYEYRTERVDGDHIRVMVVVPVEAHTEEEAINKVKDMVESKEYRDAEAKDKADKEAAFAREHRAASEEPNAVEKVKSNVRKALDKTDK